MKALRLLLTLAILIAFTLAAQAEVPKLINYQGKLTTAEGGCVDTTVQMTFSIYPDSVSIDPLWTETQPSVQVRDGVFSVLLGSVDSIPDSIFTGEIRYLGVKVEDDSEMIPRKAIVSVGYAYRTANADTAGFASNADFADSATNADMVDGMHAEEFLRYVYQDSEYRTGVQVDTWETVKSCTLPAHTLKSCIVVFYDIEGSSGSTHRIFEARITLNGEPADAIILHVSGESASDPCKSRSLKIDVDNSVPLVVALDLRSQGCNGARNQSFVILGR